MRTITSATILLPSKRHWRRHHPEHYAVIATNSDWKRLGIKEGNGRERRNLSSSFKKKSEPGRQFDALDYTARRMERFELDSIWVIGGRGRPPGKWS